MLNFAKSTFTKSVNNLTQLPENSIIEVAFAGRSNAGKSSALNAITNVKGLARTSKTPGRTQLINFFEVEPGRYLVDLPGYGYAKVSHSIQEHWQKLLSKYIQSRKQLRGLVLLMDIRHPLKDFDQQMIEWANEAGLPMHILLTKADKLGRGAAGNTLLQVQRTLANYEFISVQLFSALKLTGVEDARQLLNAWLNEIS